MLGRDRDGLAEAEGIGVEKPRVGAPRFRFVGDQDDLRDASRPGFQLNQK